MATKSKTPKLKKLDPAARKLLTKSNRQIAKERANQEADRQRRVRKELDRGKARQRTNEQVTRTNKVVAGLRSTLALVASSYPEWNNDVSILVTTESSSGYPHYQLSAWTDFERVVVEYPADRFVFRKDGTPDVEQNRASVREVLGAGYHEIGHCLYSEPFNTLGLGDEYQRSWNALEDQRMELAVTDVSPDISAYFTIIVLRNILSSGNPADAWLLVAGRLYLPRNLRQECRSAFAAQHGEDKAAEARSIIRRYCLALTVEQRASAVIDFDHLVRSTSSGVPATSGKHRFTDPEGAKDEQAGVRSIGQDRWDEDDLDEEAEASGQADDDEQVDGEGRGQDSGVTGTTEGEPGTEEQDGDGGEADGTEEAEDGTEEADGEPTGPSTDGARGDGLATDGRTPLERIQDAVDEAVRDAEQATDDGGRVDDAIKSVAAAHEVGSLPYYSTNRLLDAAGQAEALALADDFRRALEEASAYNTPTWQRHQEHGVVDPLAYRTRRPGDLSYRRSRVGDGSRGFDISVSLVLDISGSMLHQEQALSVAAYGVKSACWELDIPCTVSAYHSRARLVSAASDEPRPFYLNADEMTYITDALVACLDQREDRDQHLVLVLTDGEVDDGHEAFQALKDSGAYVIGLGLQYSSSVKSLQSLGVDEAYFIQDSKDLAVRVEEYLARVVTA